MKITYEVCKRRGQKHIKCAVCGGWITRSKVFEQTLNPFNKNKDGNVKTREEIYVELDQRISSWMNNMEKHYCKLHKESVE